MIEIEHLSKRYGDTIVVDDVSFTIGEGEIAVVVGTSGAGKSTLLRMINRLVAPDAGRVLIDGQDTTTIPEDELRFYEESAAPLSDRDRDLFLALLDKPPAANEALRRAAKEHKKRRHG